MAAIWRTAAHGGRRRALVLLAALAVVGVLGGWLSLRSRAMPADLAVIEQDVERRWPHIDQMPRQQMSRIVATGAEGHVLFDVREADEYAVSRLPGAIRVDPGLSREAFVAAHRDALRGKGVVFYCSVGVRSSMLAARVKEDLERAGAVKVLNLRGGIFAWHNEARPLVDAQGPTDRVHGYDARWGKLVQRQDKVRP